MGNRRLLGIREESVDFGMEHSQSIYNDFISKVIFNPPETITEREIEACLELLPRLAFVNIKLTNHDALVKTREPTWDLIEVTALVGE